MIASEGEGVAMKRIAGENNEQRIIFLTVVRGFMNRQP